MKIMKYKKQLMVVLHLLFWMFSINFWNIVFNPGVESSGVIKGLQDYWPELMGLNFIFYLYCLTPFIWCIKSAWKWMKISITILFLIPALYLVFEFMKPSTSRDDISLFTEFFVSAFLYVVVFHLTIAAAVYFNLRILVNKYLKVSRFGVYLLLVVSLTALTAFANFALFNFGIDQIFPSLYFISYYEYMGTGLVIIAVHTWYLQLLLFLVWQYAELLIA